MDHGKRSGVLLGIAAVVWLVFAPCVEAVVFVKATEKESFGSLVERSFNEVFLGDELAILGEELNRCRIVDYYGNEHGFLLPYSHEAPRPPAQLNMREGYRQVSGKLDPSKLRPSNVGKHEPCLVANPATSGRRRVDSIELQCDLHRQHAPCFGMAKKHKQGLRNLIVAALQDALR